MSEMEDGQILDPAVILHVLLRRRWWILLTASAMTLSTIGIIQFLPNRYTSEATVLVIQQQVPERYVVPTTTTDVSQALQGMIREVLSRARLLSIIDAAGLYTTEKKHQVPEELLDRMRRDISIEPFEASPERRTVNSFKISFIADNPRLAQDVTGRLTFLFIQENVKMREHQAVVTTEFLENQLEAVKKRLGDQEARVQGFKMQHLGELPEQQAGNVSILASLSTQLQNTEAALSRAQEQKVYLEGLLRGYQEVVLPDGGRAGGSIGNAKVSPSAALESELARLQGVKIELVSKYTPDHPDVLKANAEIARTELLLSRVKVAASPLDNQKESTSPVSSHKTEDALTTQVRSQLEANRIEIDHLTKDAAQQKETIARYQERLNTTPVREQQLAGMLRDYDLLKQNYADLQKKNLESGLAMSLEKHQEGQQFRLVDPPSLPALPSSPKRLKISLCGAAGGLAMGFALAFFVEMTGGSFHSEKQLRSHVKVPLIVALPVLLTRSEQGRRNWRRAFEWLAACALAMIVLAAELYVFRKG